MDICARCNIVAMLYIWVDHFLFVFKALSYFEIITLGRLIISLSVYANLERFVFGFIPDCLENVEIFV
jgi:hypothetical protein